MMYFPLFNPRELQHCRVASYNIGIRLKKYCDKCCKVCACKKAAEPAPGGYSLEFYKKLFRNNFKTAIMPEMKSLLLSFVDTI